MFEPTTDFAVTQNAPLNDLPREAGISVVRGRLSIAVVVALVIQLSAIWFLARLESRVTVNGKRCFAPA